MAAQQPKEGGHIMISYQHKYKDLIKRVADILDTAGFNVWLDVQEMKGGIIDSMAEAVEGADVMLLAISEGYQASHYCKKEAQYGVDLRKDIIPILVEKGFRASKWLGFIIGGQLFYDLTKEEIFNETMDKLIKDLGNRGKRKGGVQKKTYDRPVKAVVPSHSQHSGAMAQAREHQLYASKDYFKRATPPTGPTTTSSAWAEKATPLGRSSWKQFKFLFFNFHNELHAVHDGKLYCASEPEGDHDMWLKRATCIGKRGWEEFKFLFFHPDGNLYAVTNSGELYKGRPPKRADESWIKKATLIGKSSWDKFQFLFFHPTKALLYGVYKGKFYKGLPPESPKETWKANATLIGTSDWDCFDHLFFDPTGMLYGVLSSGQLLVGTPPITGKDDWLTRASLNGNDGWYEFQFLFFNPKG